MKRLAYLFSFFILISCKNEQKTKTELDNYEQVEIKYASGFEIHKYPDYTKVIVHSPWQNAEKDQVYVLVSKNAKVSENVSYDALIELPLNKIVSTSTTHIPSLISLGQINKLVGFPNLDYISSKEARALITKGKIKELGRNEVLNTEILLSVEPDVVFSFAIEGQNKTLNQIQKSGIPVVYNGDWLETDALGKAEWIKFFGAFLGELDLAIEAFEDVETSYNSIKEKAGKVNSKPTVISGAMHQDRWYLPAGNSWQAQFFEDANTDYVFKSTEGKGSIALSFENVLLEAKSAEFWISPGQFTSYTQLLDHNIHYKEFEAFQKKNIYSMANTVGETGGVLFYELGPNRPDLVLKDLVKIFYPDILKNEEFTFFKPLNVE